MQIGRTILPPTVKTTNFQCETLREDTSTYIFCFPLEQSLARTTDSGRVVRRFGSNPVGHRADKSREVGISSGNQALTRCASTGFASGLPFIRQESSNCLGPIPRTR